MTERETAKQAHFRLLDESRARQQRNWFTRHELPLLVACIGAGALAFTLSSKTAEGSTAWWFLLAIGWVAALGSVLLVPLSVIELWHTVRGSLYVHRLLKAEREDDR